MKRINAWLDKPWTTRGYLRFVGICYAITGVICALFYYWDAIKEFFTGLIPRKKDEDNDQ